MADAGQVNDLFPISLILAIASYLIEKGLEHDLYHTLRCAYNPFSLWMLIPLRKWADQTISLQLYSRENSK